MKPSTSPATTINIDFSGTRPSFIETHPNEEKQQQLNVPLLLQPSYVRSKSITFDELRNLRISLKCCALDHSSSIGKLISYVLFIFLTIIVPLLISFFVHAPASASQNDPFSFNKLVQLPESALAIISFFTLSRFFQRYGLRQLLFLDMLQDDSTFVRRGTGVFLLVCVMFSLTCELQILRFEGLHKLFEGCGSDASVQLSGLLWCLMGAARITHRAQGIVSIGTRWHMLVTNASAETEQLSEGIAGSDESDSDSSSDMYISVTTQRHSSSQTRQALVTYLQHNYGGITLFGFVLDRGLLHTLFAFEFSMVLWIISIVAV
ncbi:hypothetical protein SESBI_14547 [Sesbania bispinosa]|nr:hypothetical protein SESBI_14547 [Sesbania bispinosa]